MTETTRNDAPLKKMHPRVRARPEPRQHSQSVLGMLIEPCQGFATRSGRRIVIQRSR
jgi:hypothetical protein